MQLPCTICSGTTYTIAPKECKGLPARGKIAILHEISRRNHGRKSRPLGGCSGVPLPVSRGAKEGRDDLFPLALGLDNQLTYLAHGTLSLRPGGAHVSARIQCRHCPGSCHRQGRIRALDHTGSGHEEKRPLAEVVACSIIMAGIPDLAGMTFRLRRPAGAGGRAPGSS